MLQVPAAAQLDPAIGQEERFDYFVTCHPGLEQAVVRELSAGCIGAGDVQAGKAGVSFSGDAGVGYRSALWLRSAIRVLRAAWDVPLDPELPGGDAVYEAVREAADWSELVPLGQTFSVDGRWDRQVLIMAAFGILRVPPV